MSQLQSFPFLALPKELRLMVYERIPVEVKEHRFAREWEALDGASESNQWKNPDGTTESHQYTIVRKSLDTGIFRTCR
jgi:hypothetical protein